MNDTQPSQVTSLKDIEAVRDLFARAHDMIAQANHRMKVAEVLNFLAFQFNAFKLRAEKLAVVLANEAKAELSKVDIAAAKALTAEVIEAQVVTEAPKI